MLIFENCTYLNRYPVNLSLCFDKSGTFSEQFHFHPGIEIIYFHEGRGEVLIDELLYAVQPGTLLFVKPFQPHYLRMQIDREHPYVRSLIKYEIPFLNPYLEPFPKLQRFHAELSNNPETLPVQLLANARPVDQFLREYKPLERSIRRDAEEHALFLLRLLRYMQAGWERSPSGQPDRKPLPPVVLQIIEWINANYAQEFALEQLAQSVHLSPNHVSALFQKSMGKTITEFIVIRRLKQACMLLKTTSMPIQDIGAKAGWPNFSYFCQVFKRHTGLTPKQYRAR